MARNTELTYKRWKAMKARCYAPSYNKGYNKYQALGIEVCERWKDSYENFLEDMGECPEGYSLERVNPLRNYDKSNCVWIQIEEQPRNKTTSLYATIGSETKLLKDWAKEFNISYTTLRHRIVNQNMNIVDAIKHTNLIEYRNQFKTVKAWCEELGISYTAIITKKKRTGASYSNLFDEYIK